MATAFMKSRVLLTAVELDVFTTLNGDSLPAAQVADAIGTDERATERLMNTLCVMKLLTKKAGSG